MKNLLVAIPQLEVHRPPVSTAVIAGALEGSGHTVECIDLNILMYEQLGSDKYYDFGNIWEKHRIATSEEQQIQEEFIKKNLFPRLTPDTRLMISVFSINSHLFCVQLCRLIRKYYPTVQIVIGGAGVSGVTLGDDKETFGSLMLKEELIDYAIFGEGEAAINELVKGNDTFPGINNDKNLMQIPNLDAIAFPNYGHYELHKYDYLTPSREVNIVGSRGCVRKCTYCDVARYWPKFRFRSGQNIADEMINHYERYGVNRFYFTDSLINGSLKAFRDMCDKLAKYNSDNDAGFNWSGQFIFKPKKQLTDDYFDMITAAGGNEFYVGVETGSDKIRWEMDKKFTNEDIDYHLHHMQRTGLSCFFLMIIGYVTETLEDHQDALKMYKRWEKYVASGTISGIDLATTLYFLQNTPLANMIESHGVKFLVEEHDSLGNITPNTAIWESDANPDLTFPERIRRRLEVHETAMKYNWPIWRGPQRLESLYNIAKLYKEGRGEQVQLVNIN